MSFTKLTTGMIQRSGRLASELLSMSPNSTKQLASNFTEGLFSKAVKSAPKVIQPAQPAITHATVASVVPMKAINSSICRLCTVEDREEMIDFMCKLFVTREPLMRSTGASPESSRPFVEYCIDEALVQNASFIARDSDTGKICGLRVNAIGPASGHELQNDFGREVNIVPKFLHHMEGEMPKLLKTDRYLRHVAICVEPSVAQCGIATDLMNESVKLAKKENLLKITAMCSWRLPFKLATKIGFEKVREVSYADYAKKQQAEGEIFQPFLKLAATEKAARMMVRSLR